MQCTLVFPQGQLLTAFPRRIYYIDPYNYLKSSLLMFTTWDNPVRCRPEELSIFDPSANQTCGEYLAAYQRGMGAGTNLLNPEATNRCEVCQYASGANFSRALNLETESYG